MKTDNTLGQSCLVTGGGYSKLPKKLIYNIWGWLVVDYDIVF